MNILYSALSKALLDQPEGLMVYRLRSKFFQDAHHRQMQRVCAVTEDVPAVTQQGFQHAGLAHDLPVPLRLHQRLHMMGHS